MRRAGLAVFALAACGGGHAKSDAAVDAPPDASAPGEFEAALFPAVVNRDVDLLFMVDNWANIPGKQARFRAAFSSFVASLTTFAGGLPNLHIGIVTSDLGVTAADGTQGPDMSPDGCFGSGTSADLQTTSSAVTGNYIIDLDAGSGLRTVNFTGSLGDALVASSEVGENGCFIEQSIESTKRVLSGNPTATGFRRPGALLAIVYFTDEDDCSVSHASLFDPDTSMLGGRLFRCTRLGVTCAVGGATADEMAMFGTKSECRSNDGGTYLTSIADYVAFFRSLAADPRNVMMAAIAGPISPFIVGPNAGEPYLLPSCTYAIIPYGTDGAAPGVRLEQLVAAFRHRVFSSACDQDYTSADADIAHHIASMTGVPCLVHPLTTSRATCRAFDERADGTLTEIPACGTAGAMPCFTLDADATTCPDYDHLLANVHRVAMPPADTMVSVRCTL